MDCAPTVTAGLAATGALRSATIGVEAPAAGPMPDEYTGSGPGRSAPPTTCCASATARSATGAAARPHPAGASDRRSRRGRRRPGSPSAPRPTYPDRSPAPTRSPASRRPTTDIRRPRPAVRRSPCRPPPADPSSVRRPVGSPVDATAVRAGCTPGAATSWSGRSPRPPSGPTVPAEPVPESSATPVGWRAAAGARRSGEPHRRSGAAPGRWSGPPAAGTPETHTASARRSRHPLRTPAPADMTPAGHTRGTGGRFTGRGRLWRMPRGAGRRRSRPYHPTSEPVRTRRRGYAEAILPTGPLDPP